MFRVEYKESGSSKWEEYIEVDALKEAISCSEGFADGTDVRILKVVKEGTTKSYLEWKA